MKKWSMLLVIAIVALIMPAFSASVNAQDETGLTISKSADPSSAHPGATITYTITITNTSNVTISNIILEDSMFDVSNLDIPTSLPAGENTTVTATYTVAEEDLEQDSIVNTANVTGTDPNDNPFTASATATVELTSSPPIIEVTKTADKTSASPDETITYTYTIVNNGNVTVANITLEDDKLGPIEPLDKTSLAPGDNVTVTATYTVAEEDLPGSLVNTATVTGTDPDGNPVTASATATVELTSSPPIEEPSIEVTKSADKTSATLGDNITYTYTITNTGNVTVDNITLTDDKLGTITLSTTNLAPGENVTATATYTATISDLPGPIINTATVTGTDPTGESISLTSDPVSVSLYINKRLLTKAEILKLSGVPGKGIEKAPGLQKLFNPKSQAAEHAGKKDKDKEEEQLQIRQMTENHGAAKGQLKIRQRVENQP